MRKATSSEQKLHYMLYFPLLIFEKSPLSRGQWGFILTQIGHKILNIFCFIVEQIGCSCNAGVAGYVKLQRQARCRQENKRC